MAKGDDYKAKKKSKAIRKKLNRDPASVSARVAAIIASKKRRQSGKRRQCQGMCFSLPTPEDPYNDGLRKPDVNKSKNKKPLRQPNSKESLRDKGDERIIDGSQGNSKLLEAKKLKLENQQKTCADILGKDKKAELRKKEILGVGKTGNSGCPSKFLLMCLNSIRDSLLGDGEIEKELDEPSFVNTWGVEFWSFYSSGHNILENSGTSPSTKQIAWMASTAADNMSRMEKEGLSFKSPFLLYIVPSQTKAIEVRTVCKPLKALGIHTVILHPGTTVEHQISGLKKCDPEFLVATPVHLWKLITLKAVDISETSLLVVDATHAVAQDLDVVRRIKDSISGNPRIVFFQGSHGGSSSVQNILEEPFHSLSLA